MNKIQNSKVLFIGPDGVGKTTLLYQLKLNEIVKTLPTIGYNIENINYKDREITIFDVGGDKKFNNLWKSYIEKNCIVYIINISDKERFDYYVECFNEILEYRKEYGNIPIIIFGNKFDDKIEFEPEELLSKSNLPPEISPFIIKGNITKEEGLKELLEYIYDNIEFEEIEKNIPEEKDNDSNDSNDNNNDNQPEKESFKVVMYGLDDSGKTKILYLLKLNEETLTLPTIGFNIEEINDPNWEKNISIWDVGGGEKIRILWANYLNNINGLIWVYDINNNERFDESINELKKILNNPNLNENVPLLIYANKSDLNVNNNKKEDFIEGIEDCVKDRPYFIIECNIKNIESYKEGLDWLYNNLIK